SRPAAKTSEMLVIVILLFLHHLSGSAIESIYRKKTSGALAGTANGLADFGSALNFLKTEGFLRKCCSKASTRFWSSGWSDKIWGTSFVCASLKSSNS